MLDVFPAPMQVSGFLVRTFWTKKRNSLSNFLDSRRTRKIPEYEGLIEGFAPSLNAAVDLIEDVFDLEDCEIFTVRLEYNWPMDDEPMVLVDVYVNRERT